jgi:hypothetical protein
LGDFEQRSASQRIAAHRSAAQRIASHRTAAHRIASHRLQVSFLRALERLQGTVGLTLHRTEHGVLTVLQAPPLPPPPIGSAARRSAAPKARTRPRPSEP